MVQLVAEMNEYKANPDRLAVGTVIEAQLDKGRGPVATVLVQNGTLRQGDIIVAGTAVGRVRAMLDDKGKKIKEATPSTPVEIIGLAEVPASGDEFNAVEDERMARELAEQRKTKAKEEQFRLNAKVNLDDLFNQISEGTKEVINAVAAKLNELPPIKRFESEGIPMEMLEKKKDQGFKITEMGGDYYIEAEWLLKILNKTDIDDYESLQYLQRVLENSGVFEELRNRGVQEGDTVIIYDLEFQYVP